MKELLDFKEIDRSKFAFIACRYISTFTSDLIVEF
jgi:hypothetical protein